MCLPVWIEIFQSLNHGCARHWPHGCVACSCCTNFTRAQNPKLNPSFALMKKVCNLSHTVEHHGSWQRTAQASMTTSTYAMALSICSWLSSPRLGSESYLSPNAGKGGLRRLHQRAGNLIKTSQLPAARCTRTSSMLMRVVLNSPVDRVFSSLMGTGNSGTTQ